MALDDRPIGSTTWLTPSLVTAGRSGRERRLGAGGRRGRSKRWIPKVDALGSLKLGFVLCQGDGPHATGADRIMRAVSIMAVRKTRLSRGNHGDPSGLNAWHCNAPGHDADAKLLCLAHSSEFFWGIARQRRESEQVESPQGGSNPGCP